MRLARTIAILGLFACLPAQRASAQMLDRLWARFLPRCQSYMLSPDRSVVVSSDWDGTVQSYRRDGSVMWRVKFPTQVACVPSDGGTLSVAFVAQQASQRRVYLLDAAGRTIRVETAPGPVRTAAVSADGQVVAILSEPARVTVLHRTRHGWRWQRSLLEGTVTSLAMDATGALLAVAHRDPSGVVLLNSNLRTVWRYRGEKGVEYRLRMTADGHAFAALTLPPPGGIAQVLFWRSGSASPAWRRTLRGDMARIQMAPDGRYVAASYRTRLWHRRKSIVEPRVTLFSQAGRRLWEVGGLVFGAQLIGATASPLLVLTHDGARVLAALDGDGHMRARHRLYAPVRSCVPSSDGTHFGVLTDARVLYLFSARR